MRLSDLKIVPGLINRNNLFDDDFRFGLKINREYLADATPLFPEFENNLNSLLAQKYLTQKEYLIKTDKEEACKICSVHREYCYR